MKLDYGGSIERVQFTKMYYINVFFGALLTGS